jgi:hypothetical protein
MQNLHNKLAKYHLDVKMILDINTTFEAGYLFILSSMYTAQITFYQK